jgi:hypothetical protein
MVVSHAMAKVRSAILSEVTKLMPALPPRFEAFPELKKLRSTPGRSNVGTEISKLVQQFLSSWPFDEKWYLAANPDVAKAIKEGKFNNGREHYLNFGYFESRLPCHPDVDDAWYLQKYRDVAEGIQAGRFKSATQHFIEFGYREGRVPLETGAAT